MYNSSFKLVVPVSYLKAERTLVRSFARDTAKLLQTNANKATCAVERSHNKTVLSCQYKFNKK